MRVRGFTPVLLLWLMAAVGPWPQAAAQGIFQWVDEHGRMIYSDRPPPEQMYREIGRALDPSEAEAEAARERAREWRRLADALAEERRQRDERAAARAPSWPEPPVAAPLPERSVEIRYYPWPVYRPHWPGGRWPPKHHSPHVRYPAPEDPTLRGSAPGFVQHRRPPEFVQHRRASEFVQRGRASEFRSTSPWPPERRR
ncbi:DUF4124 domain-containing protein [Thioalkalivibrio paradoxus]|uniref:DUF4124 domain-containing protein n=1 Tax=Thioalkalivibrio paradoxus ARh 1 TaxID=713585 RepID=W0DNV8_9GAMM|nr:DUF4124 domain-containing protein [Thioalkalivibrio paradoxus]AHF00147.1 hypothetical protein THITH_10485 [Thioalkalivibrio paradoxus ARh 1]